MGTQQISIATERDKEREEKRAFEYQPTILINIIILIGRNKALEDIPFTNIHSQQPLLSLPEKGNAKIIS